MLFRSGIDANLSVMEVAAYAELSRNDKLEAPMLYSWFNASGDPYIYSGTLMDPNKAFAVWRSDDLWPRLQPLLNDAIARGIFAQLRGPDAFRWQTSTGTMYEASCLVMSEV